MENFSERNLLNKMKFYPLAILLVFSITLSYFIVKHNETYLQNNIQLIKSNYIKQQKDISIKEVHKIYNFVEKMYQKDLGKLTKEQMQKKIIDAIKLIGYDIYGYIFILDYKGNFFLNINEKLMEKNQFQIRDKNGVYVVQELINAAKNNINFVKYNSLTGTYKDESEKISYIKSFEELGWIIGYGFHPQRIEDEILLKQEKFIKDNDNFRDKIIVINIVFSMILILFLFLNAVHLENRFYRYKKIVQKIHNKNRQKDELIFQQSKMASIGEMLNIISHQWRQPLSQINTVTMDMYVEFSKNKLDKEQLENHIKDIESITKYLSNTINDFLVFFSHKKYKAMFCLKDAFDECFNILAPSLKSIDVSLNVEKDKEVFGYISLYQQVIITIISNALYIFNERNIENPKITIDISIEKGRSLVVIADNAGGIEGENISDIFNLSYSTKKDEKVSGLGLYISKKIINESFKGQIKVENSKDGAVFKILV